MSGWWSAPTHTHCGPALTSGLDFIFGNPIPPDQKARIDRYTRELTDAMEKAALEALAARAPAESGVGAGRGRLRGQPPGTQEGQWVGFGVNPNGPVDNSLPVLRVTDRNGKVRAVLFGYACHCTTLGGEFNKVCAEWAGYACDEIERQSPGATALAIIGCGADANPEPRRNLDDAKATGRPLAARRAGWSSQPLTPLPGRITAPVPADRTAPRATPRRPNARGTDQAARCRRVPGPHVDRAARPRRDAAHDGALLVQTWCFGDDMAMVFLARRSGRRLRPAAQVGDRRRAGSGSPPTATTSPATSPRGAFLSEGGYEADFSMIYYGHPSRLAPATEDLIIQTVHSLLPEPFDEPRKP